LLAAIVSEVAVIGVLILTMTVYRFLVAPGRTAAEYAAFNDLAGYYIAPTAAGLAVFLGAVWVGRKLTSSFVLNGILVGVTAVVLTGGFLFVAKPEDRLMYVVSFALRILGGYAGGVIAQRRSHGRLASVPALGKIG
jgi:hypothetical protein